jgi:hypothetical protein
MSKPYLGKVTGSEQKQLNKIMNSPIKRTKEDKAKPTKSVNLNIRGEKPQ